MINSHSFLFIVKENNRERLDSASSDISQFSIGQNFNTSMNYVSPPRHFMPPSDIESEYGGDESDHETNTVHKCQTYSLKSN